MVSETRVSCNIVFSNSFILALMISNSEIWKRKKNVSCVNLKSFLPEYYWKFTQDQSMVLRRKKCPKVAQNIATLFQLQHNLVFATFLEGDKKK